jgi:hypothetical protein
MLKIIVCDILTILNRVPFSYNDIRVKSAYITKDYLIKKFHIFE